MNSHHMTALSTALAQAGQPFTGDLIPSEWLRYGDKRGQSHYWLRYHHLPSGHLAGTFGNWRTGEKHTFRSWDNGADTSKYDAAKFQREYEQRQQQAEAKQAKRHADAAALAADMLENMPDHGQSTYLKQKGVNGYGVHYGNDYHGQFIAVPVRTIAGELTGLQKIYDQPVNGKAKLFLPGTQKRGAFHQIGDIAGEIVLCEGYSTAASVYEATGKPVLVCFDAGNMKPVAEAIRAKYPDATITIAADNDQFKAVNVGVTKATEAAKLIGARLAIPQFTDTSSKPTDFNDLALLSGNEAVKDLIEQAQDVEESHDEIITRLAALPPLEADLQIKATADKHGFTVGTLRKEIARQQKELEAFLLDDTESIVEDLDAWPKAVDGAALLDAIKAKIEAHVIVPDGAPAALALWIFGSYAYDAFRIWPKLLISSPEKRCGKTTLLEVLGALCYRPLPTSNISAAALFRTVDAFKPSLLIDEADTFLNDKDELQGIINSGHTKAQAFVIRLVGDDHQPKKFSTWCPMALAMIGKPRAGTITDRSVIIPLRRKLPGEAVSKTPIDAIDAWQNIRRQCLRWAQDHVERLPAIKAAMPTHGNDRTVDNWTPLFTIAEAAGGNWPALALHAFTALALDHDDDDSIGPMVLADIKAVFEDKGTDRIHTQTLVFALIDLEDRPWAEWRRGGPITGNSLSRLLKPYKIRPGDVRIGSQVKKGYMLASFNDAFDRYLKPQISLFSSDPPIQSATTLQATDDGGYSDFQSATTNESVAFQNSPKATDDGGCSVVAFQKGGSGEEKEKTRYCSACEHLDLVHCTLKNEERSPDHLACSEFKLFEL